MNAFVLAGRSNIHLLRQQLTVQRNLLTRRFARNASSKPPPPPNGSQQQQQAQQQYRTIPGPSWAWIEPLTAPFRAYGRMQKRSPLQTQLSSSLSIYFLGDLSAQLVSGSGNKGANNEYSYEPIRGVRALIIGGISSIPSYKWFLFLGNHFNFGSHAVSIAVKIVVNQMVFTPIFNTYFFGMQTLLAGGSLREARKRVVDTVPVSWRNSWKVWPIVTAFSFTFVQPQYRSVFAGVIAIGWQTYLSWLNMAAAKMEGVEEGGKRKKERKTTVASKK